jgi:hypothetical protein
MAMTFDRNKLLIEEGIVRLGTWSSPELITAATLATTSPFVTGGWSETDLLGYFEMGTLKASIEDENATFKSGTPHKKVRIDLIERQFNFKTMAAQFDPEHFEKAMGMFRETGGDWDMAWVGANKPVPTYWGVRIDSRLVDGTPMYVCIWSALPTGTQLGIQPDGSKHATYEFNLEALEGPTFTGTYADDQRCYGAIIQDVS